MRTHLPVCPPARTPARPRGAGDCTRQRARPRRRPARADSARPLPPQIVIMAADVGTRRGGRTGADAATVRDWDGLRVRQTRFSRMENERAEGECRPCAAGKYQAVVAATGSKTCLDCPTHTSSLPGAASLLDCICEAGYTGFDGGPCARCEAGQYKSAAGSAACRDCSPGAYSRSGASACTACAAGTFEGATGATACSGLCPAHATSAPGSEVLADCVCAAGYTGCSPPPPPHCVRRLSPHCRPSSSSASPSYSLTPHARHPPSAPPPPPPSHV